jgi:hypothetical protein
MVRHPRAVLTIEHIVPNRVHRDEDHMAKSKTTEAGVPLIIALVFFILTTITFGVMWYLAYSDIEAKAAEAKKLKDELTPVRNAQREAELKARVYRIYMGIDEGDDKTTVDSEKGLGSTVSAELSRINDAVAKKLGKPDVSALPEDFKFWKTDANKKAESPPAEALLDQIAKLEKKEAAYKAAEDERTAYKAQIKGMEASIAALDSVKKKFQADIDKMPVELKTELEKVTKGFDARTKLYQQAEAAANDKITKITDKRDEYASEVKKLRDTIAGLQIDNRQLQARIQDREKETFTFDEPQGKILRKLPEGVVEINLGSAAGVLPGLTFTVLPPDYPEKGRQSRVRMLRVPDGRGAFKSIESFVPKGALEVYEVVGPNLSLARVQAGSELDPIRDGVTVGDLIYNSVWRKGVADHIALIGIFDMNGDGTDDIQSVVRDLNRMGVPVDAYYDMKKRQWVGQVTERTRYIVEGYYPIQGAQDPNREEKTKLLGALSAAVNEGKQKGVSTINFRDLFSRMGYKFRLDVSDDKINQATAPYLSTVGVGNPAAPPTNP